MPGSCNSVRRLLDERRQRNAKRCLLLSLRLSTSIQRIKQQAMERSREFEEEQEEPREADASTQTPVKQQQPRADSRRNSCSSGGGGSSHQVRGYDVPPSNLSRSFVVIESRNGDSLLCDCRNCQFFSGWCFLPLCVLIIVAIFVSYLWFRSDLDMPAPRFTMTKTLVDIEDDLQVSESRTTDQYQARSSSMSSYIQIP